MAKATFPCAKCGVLIAVGGYDYTKKGADDLAALRQKRGDICFTCQDLEWQEENEKAVADSAALGLAELTGTPRQVGWACKIRLQKLPEIEKEKDRLITNIKPVGVLSPESITEISDAIALIASELAMETRAGQWIDIRDTPARTLFENQCIDRFTTLIPNAMAELKSLVRDGS